MNNIMVSDKEMHRFTLSHTELSVKSESIFIEGVTGDRGLMERGQAYWGQGRWLAPF